MTHELFAEDEGRVILCQFYLQIVGRMFGVLAIPNES